MTLGVIKDIAFWYSGTTAILSSKRLIRFLLQKLNCWFRLILMILMMTMMMMMMMRNWWFWKKSGHFFNTFLGVIHLIRMKNLRNVNFLENFAQVLNEWFPIKNFSTFRNGADEPLNSLPFFFPDTVTKVQSTFSPS